MSRLATALHLARRAVRKPPHVVARRAVSELDVELERFRAPLRGRRLRPALPDWDAVLARPYPFVRTPEQLAALERTWPGERPRVLEAAERALRHEVDLLGTGAVLLGDRIDWHRDWKTGRTWPLRYGRRMEYAELDRPSDVKVPWEISRVQWLLPVGQAYALTGEERYAEAARDVLADWMRSNPYALGVNWALAMEPALRIFSWTWLLHACGRSTAWADEAFRSRFLRSLYLHGDFVERNIERSEINGNHYTADAAGLVVAGLVLEVERWASQGWAILADELPRQVHPDGVDFEASSAYHRLVGELFALPAILRRAHGLPVDAAYAERLDSMGRFTRAYTGPDGLAPLWGDADDGRALPLGGQDVNDHASLPALTAAGAGRPHAGNPEAAWLLGSARAASDPPTSAAFPHGGVYILAHENDHVFVDCGPIGLAGRGGHGHNDCLSFEATLDRVRLVRDSGSYVYTASPKWRNRFRSTAFHSTPQVDGQEQNRIEPRQLWTMSEDALPVVRVADALRFQGAHTGYRRLKEPVTPVRSIELVPDSHRLIVDDTFEGDGEHLVEIPLQLEPGVEAEAVAANVVALSPGFLVQWENPSDWRLEIEQGWVSPSYGVRRAATRLRWTRRGPLRPLHVEIGPR